MGFIGYLSGDGAEECAWRSYRIENPIYEDAFVDIYKQWEILTDTCAMDDLSII